MKKEKYNIKKSFENEPGYIPDKEQLWQKIDKNLLTDDLYSEVNKESLHYAIEDLPKIKPHKNIWSTISNELPVNKITNTKQRKILYAISATAAGLIFGLFINLFIKYQYDRNITYTKEIIHFTDINQEEAVNYNDFKNEIIILCENKPVACQNEDFIDLKNKLEQLNIEKQKLSEEVLIKNNPGIQTYLEIVDGQIKNIEYQIINYLNS